VADLDTPRPRDREVPDRGRAIRVAVVGTSIGPTSGMRDHAVLLADALGQRNVSCSMHWLLRSEASMRGARAEIQAWARGLAAELAASRPDVILLHYSVFAYAHRGVPLFVRSTLSRLRGTGIPLVGVLHEFAYPWELGGWRGKVWAVTQRALLVEVMRSCVAAVVTTDSRAQWLASRPWLPGRRVVLAPVFSNLPPPAAAPERDGDRRLIGLFGYSYQGTAVSLVLDAISQLVERGVDLQLLLLGAPGRASPAGEEWLSEAATRELSGVLSFSGILPAQELSDTLAGCEVLLCADTSGPSSRKGTLAGSLASGSPVIAIDGPNRWTELIESGGARVVAPTPAALADAVGELLDDERARKALGARGRLFAEQESGVGHSAEIVSDLLGEVLSGNLA
jgi:glycosyltransferase involved in cell wall biosynthesis